MRKLNLSRSLKDTRLLVWERGLPPGTLRPPLRPTPSTYHTEGTGGGGASLEGVVAKEKVERFSLEVENSKWKTVGVIG